MNGKNHFSRSLCPSRHTLTLVCLFVIILSGKLRSQPGKDLDSGWKCKNVMEVHAEGEIISRPGYSTDNWLPATVPGTVLTTLVDNGLMPDPNFGMNNELIPDIYDTGNTCYTYWFVNDFRLDSPSEEDQVWLHFRGINYSCDVFLNGRKLNEKIHKGMFLRQTYHITSLLSKDGDNRLAVIVYPPDPPGNPNGGQGGDGVIGKHVAHQYVAGWDWIQPVRDRNTGIWDKVSIERTGAVNIKHPHVVTRVEGLRHPDDSDQGEAWIELAAELENPTSSPKAGMLSYQIEGLSGSLEVKIPPTSSITVRFPDLQILNPRLWWPNGYGPQSLYELKLEFQEENKRTSDEETIRFGIREFDTAWNPMTRSLEFLVNGQRIFIKGGNWIISDAMLRFSRKRYDAEVRFHRDMNLNLIRIWGGAITERPEFYEACDRYGILVWQDFWMSGDCNGRWLDPRKKDDQWTRRRYPDDHDLFIRSVVDQVKMIRNHPSLAIWCGGNEIGPPEDMVKIMNDTLDSDLDGTRLFLESSTSGELYFNFKGGTGDGPYGIQEPISFWADRSFPFNPELGSVGTGDEESLARFIPDTSMVVPGLYKSNGAEGPGRWRNIEPVWRYHKYIGYGDIMEKYGAVNDVATFSKIAQLVNYDQYRAMVEGFSAHMWEWYTGFIIWKTQNPWTALRGQMYDWYLDPNGGLYGLHNGSEPLHIMFNPVNQMIMVVNNTFDYYRDVMVVAYTIDAGGNVNRVYQQLADIDPVSVKNCQPVGRGITARSSEKGTFLMLKLLRSEEEELSENLYWLSDSTGHYPFLEDLASADLQAVAEVIEPGKISLTMINAEGNPLAFFLRISLRDRKSGKRILPVFFSDNYVSIESGKQKMVLLEYPRELDPSDAVLHLEGWNLADQYVDLK